jgi:hypothetical protein
MITIVLLLIVSWLLPKLFPYWNMWINVILITAITVFAFLVEGGIAPIIVVLFDIGYGYQLFKHLIQQAGQKNLRRHIEKQQNKK